MIFCPRCGAILVPKKDGKRMSCACGYSSKQKQNVIIEEKVQLGKEEKIEVVDKKIETLPKTKEECPRCKHGEAYFWTVQTRAGDEAETRFFECVKCKNRWRSYN
ncbi:transcription factor S [Candidatus Woesearchaeota archaeon]|nr:transcription factor S [Candidatus Woesearchaeota archaeon]